jgi:hypothetical protein
MDDLTRLQVHTTLEKLRAIERAVATETIAGYGAPDVGLKEAIRHRTDNAVRIFCTLTAQ